MAFNANVIISGVCAYVPDKDISPISKPPYRDLPKQMWVLLPEARRRSGKKKALDGRDLTTHFPVLSFSVDDLQVKGSVALRRTVTTPILFENVTFILEPTIAMGYGNEFEVIQDSTVRDFRHGVDVHECSKNYVDINPECFKDQGAQHDLVGSRILLNSGKVAAHELNDKQKWKLSNSLGGGGSVSRLLSNMVSVTFSGLTKLTIRLTPFGGETKRDIVLARDSGDVVVEIGNLCDACILEGLIQEVPPPRAKDEDFRWLFELCKDTNAIRDELDHIFWKSSLPIPERVGNIFGGGSRLVECMRMTYAQFSPANNPRGVIASLGNLVVNAKPSLRMPLEASSPYHRQSSNFECGAAAAMMILGDTDIGADVSTLSQDSIYAAASSISPSDWHISPTALSIVLNDLKPRGDIFLANVPSTWEDGCRDIVAALLQDQIPPAVVTEADDHWVTVDIAMVGSNPLQGDFILYGYTLHNPWCPTSCPSKHSVDDNCLVDGLKPQWVTYWEWRNIFRESAWKDGDRERRGFASVTRRILRHVGKIVSPPRFEFRPRGVVDAIEILNAARLIDDTGLSTLSSAELIGPLRVNRLDEEGDYFLFGFMDAGEVLAQVKVEASSFGLERFQWESEGSKQWAVFSQRTQNLGKELQGMRNMLLEDAEPGEIPHLVWQPCDESRTPFLPFFDISIDENKAYLRIDGALPKFSEFMRERKGG
jgi:hypothetical protein